MNICSSDLIVTSRKIACERTKLTIASDRLACSCGELIQMKQEMADILDKYMIINDCVSEIRLNIVYDLSRGKQNVKTIQIK